MIKQIVETLKNDGVVAVPTETVYGLAVCLNSKKAINKLMQLKDRDYDSGKIFTLVPEDRSAIKKYVQVSETAQQIIDQYVPGEVTLILPKNPDFKHPYYDHFDTIGIRIPKYSLFEAILPEVGPLLLTSANLRGGEPVYSSKELAISADYVEDGISGQHQPSTIIDMSSKTPKILRQGEVKISVDNIAKKY